jgi:hypothetical protein
MIYFIGIVAVCVLSALGITVYLFHDAYDKEGATLATLGSWLVIAIVCFVWLASCDYAQSIRAFDAMTACQSARGVPQRKPFDTRVVCTQAVTRQDTVTVQIP